MIMHHLFVILIFVGVSCDVVQIEGGSFLDLAALKCLTPDFYDALSRP